MSDKPANQSVEKYGVSINLHDFGQTVFEDYQLTTIKAAQAAFFQFGADGSGVTAQAHVRGVTVRTALHLKIISGIQFDDVKDMKPYIVAWIADEVKKHVTSVATAPNDPN
jgi:hypothetical protein